MLNTEQVREIQHLFEEVGDLTLLEYLLGLDLPSNVKEQIERVHDLNVQIFPFADYDKSEEYFAERSILMDMLGFNISSGIAELKSK